MSIYGADNHFVGYLNNRTCQRCNNNVTTHLYAGRSYQVHFFVKVEGFHDVHMICPVCEQGEFVSFYYATRNSRGFLGPANWRERKEQTMQAISFIESNIQVEPTARHYSSLSPKQKSFYQIMLTKLGLYRVLQRVMSSNK